MIVDMNYAKAGVTPGCFDLCLVDRHNAEVPMVQEVNCVEGWAIVLTHALGSQQFIDQRIEGQFRLMHKSAAKKLGVRFQ